MMKGSPKVTILDLVGAKPKGEADGEGEMGAKDLALKGMFKALKDNDFEGFKAAWYEVEDCSAEMTKPGEGETESSDE